MLLLSGALATAPSQALASERADDPANTESSAPQPSEAPPSSEPSETDDEADSLDDEETPEPSPGSIDSAAERPSTPGGAAAIGSDAVLTILKSKCVDRDDQNRPTRTWRGAGRWAGDKQNALDSQVRGKMLTCFSKYRYTHDGSKKYNYYVALVETRWRCDDGDQRDYDAIVHHQIVSNKTARSSWYDGTESHESSSSCSKEVSVGLQAGLVSFSTNVAMCSDYKVDLASLTTTGARWTSRKAAGVQHLTTAYMQKVLAKPGAPTFTMNVSVPHYGVFYDASEAHWRSSQNWVSVQQENVGATHLRPACNW